VPRGLLPKMPRFRNRYSLPKARQTGTPTNLEELLKLGRNAFTDSRYVHEQIPSDRF
jgi:hypothetical protein